MLKFLTGDPDVQSYYFTEGGDLPTIKGGSELIPSLSVLPDAEIIVTEPGYHRATLSVGGLGSAMGAAGGAPGAHSPARCRRRRRSAQAQRETDYWLSQQ